jgi:RHS repeat-associated protein
LGRQYDSETGNNYLINRYYNTGNARFLSPDRYQYVQDAIPFTSNLYQYGYANPLVNVDPEGLESTNIDGQKYQLVPVSGSDEMFPIHQSFYDILNKLIGTNGGTIAIFDNDGNVHNVRFTKQELQNQQGTIRLFESRFLALYGEKRGLDHVQITAAAANTSTAITASGVLLWGLAEYGALEPMANGGKWLARRMFNRQTLLKGARAGWLSMGFNFTASLGLNMLANHGDFDKSMSEIDGGDLVVSFFTGYLTAPLATSKKVYDILSFGGLNVMDKYIKSKVGSEKYEYDSKYASFDFVLGGLSRLLQQLHYDRAQATGEAKRLYKYLDHLQRTYRRLSAPRKLELKAAEKAAVNYGKYLKDVLWQKGLKTTTEKLLRPKQETGINDREVQP